MAGPESSPEVMKITTSMSMLSLSTIDSTGSTPTGFLALPAELRNTIYALAFADQCPDSLAQPGGLPYNRLDCLRGARALTQVCQTTRMETLPILYSSIRLCLTAVDGKFAQSHLAKLDKLPKQAIAGFRRFCFCSKKGNIHKLTIKVDLDNAEKPFRVIWPWYRHTPCSDHRVSNLEDKVNRLIRPIFWANGALEVTTARIERFVRYIDRIREKSDFENDHRL